MSVNKELHVRPQDVARTFESPESIRDRQRLKPRGQNGSLLMSDEGRIDALIFIRNDVTEIEELPPVKPWLQEQDEFDN